VRWKWRGKYDVIGWHPWFAWHPVRLEAPAKANAGPIVWLEWVERHRLGAAGWSYIQPRN
jgi:hypothetical protein